MAGCACQGCSDCTVDPETGRCCQNIANKEKKWTKKGMQMCAFCAEVRDDVGDARPPPPPRSSSSSQIEERVRTLETAVETLQQALSTSATLVENLEQQLEQALQRVAELEAAVGDLQQWNEQAENKQGENDWQQWDQEAIEQW